MEGIDYNEKFSKLDWDKLLDEKTINIIRRQGKFVIDEEISKKLGMEDSLPAFEKLSEKIFEVGKVMVIKKQYAMSLLDQKAPDAPKRQERLMEDESEIFKMIVKSQQENARELSTLVQAVKNLGSGGKEEGRSGA